MPLGGRQPELWRESFVPRIFGRKFPSSGGGWLVGDDRDGTVTEISTEVLIFLW
jgi:hypothetical protein